MAIFLLGESHGWRSLEGYSPWGHKESDTTEATEHASKRGTKLKVSLRSACRWPSSFPIAVQLIYSVVLVSGVQQTESVIHIHISTLFQILFPYRSLQSTEQSFLCHIVSSYQLSILYIVPRSSTLAWKIPWTEEPGRLQSMGSRKSRTQLSNLTFTFHFHALEKEMTTHSSVLAWRIPGTAEPGGLPSMGSHRVGHDCSDLAAAAAANIF